MCGGIFTLHEITLSGFTAYVKTVVTQFTSGLSASVQLFTTFLVQYLPGVLCTMGYRVSSRSYPLILLTEVFVNRISITVESDHHWLPWEDVK